MSGSQQLPYSRQGLENLAAALNIQSALIWVNPGMDRLEIKQLNSSPATNTEDEPSVLADTE